MSARCFAVWCVFAILFWSGEAWAQPAPAQPLSEITRPEPDKPKLLESLFSLTDATGPRVVGSPALETSRHWLEGRLKEYGLRAIRREANLPMEVAPGVTWDPKGWSWSKLHVQQTAPWQTPLIAIPVLYSPSTKGKVSGEVVIAPLPPPREEAVQAFMEEHRGNLNGRFILLHGTERGILRNPDLMYRTYTQADLEGFQSLPPQEPSKAKPAERKEAPPQGKQPTFEEAMALQSRLHRFLKSEGVLGMIGAARGEGGTLFVRPPAAPPDLAELPPPSFDLAPEHFNRIIRLLRHRVPVTLEVDLSSEFHGAGTVNLLAEIPGTDKADELVVAGAHLDSWHGGTGATDNAVGVAVLLETARILAASGNARRRTIRFAFWDGHELGTIGSRSYAALHLKDPDSGSPKDEYGRTSCYFNLDYGAGRIRGVYLQGRMELKDTFESWLAGVDGEKLVASPRTTLGSDQATFERLGIPGISFIQDPLNYEVRTHHTSMDLPDYASPDDMMHAVRVLAHLLMEAANAEQPLPRTAAANKP